MSRRDSFITHRAFCDALAEETARLNAASNMNNAVASNINYHFMGNPLGPSMAQHFPSMFKPISSNHEETINQTTRGLSLWMGQGSQGQEAICNNNLQGIHQLGSVSSGAIFGDPLVSCSNPPPSDYQLNWVFGTKLSSSNAEELTSTTSLPLSDVKEAATQLLSVPSLYSTQQQSHQTPSANMSATALLQKAAQIGATSTDPSFLGSFGLKCSESQVRDGNKLCALYGSNPILTNLGNGVEDDLLQIHPAKRRHITQNEESGGGQTRDFLGVGVQPICHPPINGWM